jgi:hypothetical protein
MEIDFLSGVGKGRSIAFDCRETINWYPELAEVDGAKSKIVLYPTPGLKLFGNPYAESYSAPAENTIVAAFTARYNNETAVSTQFVTLTFTATKQKIVKNYSWSFGDGITVDGTKTLLTTDDNIVTHKYDLTNGLINSGTLPVAIQPAGYTGGTGKWATVVLTVNGYDGQTASYTGYVYKITSNGTIIPVVSSFVIADSINTWPPDTSFNYSNIIATENSVGSISWLWEFRLIGGGDYPYIAPVNFTTQNLSNAQLKSALDLAVPYGLEGYVFKLTLIINGYPASILESDYFTVTT